jgi:hypothetical protein
MNDVRRVTCEDVEPQCGHADGLTRNDCFVSMGGLYARANGWPRCIVVLAGQFTQDTPIVARGVSVTGPARDVCLLLQPPRVSRLHRRTGPNAIVQWLKRYLAVGELAFQPLVPIETELRGIREVRTELDEQRAEVAVQNVDVIVIDHRGRANDPWIDAPGIAALLRAEHAVLLLGLADEEDAFVAVECREIVLRDVVFPLALLEGDPSAATNCSMASTNR